MTTQLLNHTIENHETRPSIYVACLPSYTNGILYGTWINAAQPLENILEQTKQLLAKSPMPGAEEFAIHDFEGFGTLRIDEYESLQQVHEKALFIVEHGTLEAELIAYYGGGLEDAKEALENNYMGEYESELDYAIHLFDECYLSNILISLQVASNGECRTWKLSVILARNKVFCLPMFLKKPTVACLKSGKEL